jgi:hypothetical protein
MLRAASRKKGDEMKPRSNHMAFFLTTIAVATLGGGAGCGSSTPAGDSTCTDLTNYHASTTTPVSFATDVYPILSDTNVMNGCGQVSICHGNPPSGLDDLFSANKKTLQFVFDTPDPAMAKAQLLMASVNAPSMPRVTPSNVGQSFLAYKISGRAALACVNAMCVAGASIGNNQPCGDVMPSVGQALSDANRTKILDWIALGAAN